MSELGQTTRQIIERGRFLENAINLPKTPLGIKTPLEKGKSQNGESLFKMHYDIENQIVDNLRNLLMTQKGERIGFSDFGTRLKEIYSDTDLTEDQVADSALIEIKNTVSKYMPSIELKQFYSERASESDKLNMSNINANRFYDIQNSSIDFPRNPKVIEENKDNSNIDSIYKVKIDFIIPIISNKIRSIEMFINSGK